MNTIHFLCNKLIDNGISKFTVLCCHLLIPPKLSVDARQERSSTGPKGAKAAFQILAKRCVFISAVKINENLNFETRSEGIITCVECREFYSVT